MCSKFLHFLATFLFPLNVLRESLSVLQVDQQLQTELDQAAEKGMVSTRSHDNTPASATSKASKALYPQVLVHEKKRKIGNEIGESPAQAVSKRRRKSMTANSDETPPSAIRKRGKPRKNAAAKTTSGDTPTTINHREVYQEPSPHNSRPTSPQINGMATNGFHDVSGEDKAIKEVTDDHTKEPRSEALDVQDQETLDTEGATRAGRGGILKKKTKSPKRDADAGENGANGNSVRDQPKTPIVTTTKAIHRRFGSEDVDVLEIASAIGIEERKGSREDLSEDESKSEDDSPEMLTASAGLDQARTLAKGQLKVATRQKAEKKLRRKEHDQRLKMQAKSAKDSRSKHHLPTESQETKDSVVEVSEGHNKTPVERLKFSDEFSKATGEKDRNSPKQPNVLEKDRLPLMLPDEILAAKPIPQIRKPPFTNSKVAVGQKRKLLNFESKPPKDVKLGNVTICYLQDKQTILPPESSLASKAIRESWLTGKRSFKGAMQVPRRKPSSSFVRKR